MSNPEYGLILQDSGVDKEDTESCMSWAFGNDWKALETGQHLINRWNLRHGILFRWEEEKGPIKNLQKIGYAYRAMHEDHCIRLDALYDLNESEKRFRVALVKSFAKEGIRDPNEMMDCLNWGLNSDKNLLRCHTYHEWPDAFARNAGIEVSGLDSIEKCIRLLARKWKSKKKFTVVRTQTYGR